MSITQVFDIPIGENKQDLAPKGTFGFPLAIYLQELHKNVLGFVNWHWHDEVQFCMVVRGEITFHVNSRHFLLREDEGLFINTGCIHMAEPYGGSNATYICLNADPKLLSTFPGSSIDNKYLRPLLTNPALSELPLAKNIDWQAGILHGVTQIFNFTRDKTATYEIDVLIQLFTMFGHLVRNSDLHGALQAPNKTDHRLKSIFNYIHLHYAEEITLIELANAAYMSKSACCRFFKDTTNTTLFQYINDYRMNKSLELLNSSDLNISHIASTVGFGSVSYFIEKFRLRTGMTPKEFRKQLARL